MSKRRTHKILAGGLALALALSVGACGRSSGDASSGGKGDDGKAKGELKSAPGFDMDKGTITLGVLTPTSTLGKLIGDPLTAGNYLYYESLNARGGIAGKYKVDLIVKDNKYGGGDNTATATAYGQIKDQVAAFQQVLGTDPVNSILPQLGDDNIIAGPATLDAEWYHEPNLMPILAPYQVQAANALAYYIDKMGGKGKNICTLTSDDGYGKAGLAGAEFTADKLGFDIVEKQTFTSAASGGNYAAQVQKLQQSKCDAVWLVSLPTDSNGIFNEAQSKNFQTQWIGTSPTWINLVANDYTAKNYIVAAQGPEWGDTSTDGMKQLLADVEKFGPAVEKKLNGFKITPNFYFAFGYMQAEAMSQILEKAVADGDMSREGIMNAMNTVGKLTFRGSVSDIPYGAPDDRKPVRETTLFKVTPDTMDSNGGLTLLAKDAMNFSYPVAEEVPLK